MTHITVHTGTELHVEMVATDNSQFTFHGTSSETVYSGKKKNYIEFNLMFIIRYRYYE